MRFETGLAYVQLGEMQGSWATDRSAEQAYLRAIRIFQELGDARLTIQTTATTWPTAIIPWQPIEAKSWPHCRGRAGLSAGPGDHPKAGCRLPRPIHNWIAGRLNNIGITLHETGRFAEAESVHREALAIRIAFDRNSAVMDETSSNLGDVLQDAGRPAEAEQFYRRALEICQNGYPPDSQHGQVRLASAHVNLANNLRETGRLNEAESNLRKALAIGEKLAANFPNTPISRSLLTVIRGSLADFLVRAGQPTDAEKTYRENLKEAEKLAVDFPVTPEHREVAGRWSSQPR